MVQLIFSAINLCLSIYVLLRIRQLRNEIKRDKLLKELDEYEKSGEEESTDVFLSFNEKSFKGKLYYSGKIEISNENENQLTDSDFTFFNSWITESCLNRENVSEYKKKITCIIEDRPSLLEGVFCTCTSRSEKNGSVIINYDYWKNN
jgi:hypothetical protein